MKIAVIGVGNIGRTLGQKWAETGHTVVLGSEMCIRQRWLRLSRKLWGM